MTTNKELSNYIEEMGDLPARGEAKDLGTTHDPGRKRKIILRDTRALNTIQIWNKIAGPSIPKAKRRLMAATAGSAKACYESTVNRTTQDSLNNIRASALKATHGDNTSSPITGVWGTARNLEGRPGGGGYLVTTAGTGEHN